jgi:molecular chaperone GrpE
MTNDTKENQESPLAETSGLSIPKTPTSDGGVHQPGYTSSPRAAAHSSELENLRQDIAAIRELIQKRLSHDKVKEEAFDRLYAELERLKRHSAVLDNKSFYIDLILLYDRMDAACEHAVGELGQVILSLREELKEILLRRDVHRISTGHDLFEPRFQRAVSTKKVVSQEKDGRVISVLREGFICGELVIRPQEVVLGRFSSAPTTDEHADGTTKSNKET